MNFGNEITKDELEIMETNLEELALYIINILKDYKRNGLIEEDEYIKHTKIKEEYLTFLREKRKDSAVI